MSYEDDDDLICTSTCPPDFSHGFNVRDPRLCKHIADNFNSLSMVQQRYRLTTDEQLMP